MTADPIPAASFLERLGIAFLERLGIDRAEYRRQRAHATPTVPRRPAVPILEYRATLNQADPDPRERAAEAALAAAGDYDDPHLALDVLRGLRPDLSRDECREVMYDLYGQAAKVAEAAFRGRAWHDMECAEYDRLLHGFVTGRAT